MVSLLLVAIGALYALAALQITQRRVANVLANVSALHLERGQHYLDRINDAAAKMPSLVERANAATAEMNGSFAELKLPEAIGSLRNAAAAVKLLVSGR